eukprot:TRINITY_DN9224_c0_g1_i1.p1 TRINITY_DN9224_c0_g1~~TRINITY_DN9224_c0_g1_i1.p1  ORF type:complete len:206 (+),score=43.34 TRINITY_DN9224_c0_g1_i1:43-660(+)
MASSPESYDHIFKLLLVGDSGVGKSSIMNRFCTGQYEEDNTSTIGVDFKIKLINIGDKRVKLTIWDTAGQEKFRTLTSSYYRGAHGIIMVYDVTSSQSFESLSSWMKEVESHSTHPDAIKMLVANKIDQESKRKVVKDSGLTYARSNNMIFMECSAKTRVGVQQAFEELVTKILDSPTLTERPVQPSGASANISSPPANQGGCGC